MTSRIDSTRTAKTNIIILTPYTSPSAYLDDWIGQDASAIPFFGNARNIMSFEL